MKQLFSLLSVFLLASCSSEVTETVCETTNNNLDKVILLQSHPFEWEDGSRTMLTVTDAKLAFSWTDGDAIGVFPVKPTTNSQAKQVLHVAPNTDAHFATFDGAGWDLKDGNMYAAYSPYNASLTSDVEYMNVPVELTGQDGTLETLGSKYDFMYAPSSGRLETTGDGVRQVVFDFQHAISIIQLKLIMPVAAKWKSITLGSANGNEVWISSANMNVADGTLSSIVKTSGISLKLKNVMTTEEDKNVTLYLAVFPTTTGRLVVNALDEDGKEYAAMLDNKTIVAGKAYRYVASLKALYSGTENGYAFVDLGLGVKWATMNVGATCPTEDGNCYAWGETKPHSNNIYDWASYNWCNGAYSSLTKYCTRATYGTFDNKNMLEDEDDAAKENWGGTWRLPTLNEQEELVKCCYSVSTLNYCGTGKSGLIIYKAKSSSDQGKFVDFFQTPSSNYSLTEPHIFIPYAECIYLGYVTSGIMLWSSSLDTQNNNNAIYMGFNMPGGLLARCCGLSVRAVCVQP